MKINSLLGLAAIAGAAYFLKSEKGKSFVNQYSGQVNDLFAKGEKALKNVTDRIRNSSWNAESPKV